MGLEGRSAAGDYCNTELVEGKPESRPMSCTELAEEA